MSDWKIRLARLFAATVNQEPLEEAADLMVSVSARDLDYHKECLATLNGGIQACDSGEMDVILAISKSGYKVTSLGEAKELLVEFLKIYEKKFEQEVRPE